jgi:hypothetical protein
MEPVANCHRTGNHLGIQPHTFKDNIEFLCDELADMTGVRVDPPINRKGAEILFVVPSADYFADPGTTTFMGYLLLFSTSGSTTPGAPTPRRAATSGSSPRTR